MLQFKLKPWQRHNNWTHEVERMLEGFSEDLVPAACEIIDTPMCYKIFLDVPGLNKEDITIEVKDRQLLISGERKLRERSQDERVLRQERRFGKFYRTFSLPEGIAEERAEAKFTDGVLEVRLPRTTVEVRRIPVD